MYRITTDFGYQEDIAGLSPALAVARRLRDDDAPHPRPAMVALWAIKRPGGSRDRTAALNPEPALVARWARGINGWRRA